MQDRNNIILFTGDLVHCQASTSNPAKEECNGKIIAIRNTLSPDAIAIVRLLVSGVECEFKSEELELFVPVDLDNVAEIDKAIDDETEDEIA